MLALWPVFPPVVALTTWIVEAVVLAVKLMVATPLAFVTEVGLLNDPPPVEPQVTVWPLVFTKLLFASASWADTTTVLPATGDVFGVVTRYLAAAPALNAT